MSESAATVLKLVEAAFLGGLIGLERERTNQPAGLRTHIILCLGSALIMVISERIAGGGPNYDPGRIAAQVVSGIGFLGAGAILRMGPSVRGLTTAASIWTTAGIGLAVGAGFHIEAVSAVAIMLLALAYLKRFGRRLSGKRRFKLLDIEVRGGEEDLLQEMEDIVSRERCDIREMDVRKDPEKGTMRIRIQMTTPRDFEPAPLLEALTRHGDVIEADVR